MKFVKIGVYTINFDRVLCVVRHEDGSYQINCDFNISHDHFNDVATSELHVMTEEGIAELERYLDYSAFSFHSGGVQTSV